MNRHDTHQENAEPIRREECKCERDCNCCKDAVQQRVVELPEVPGVGPTQQLVRTVNQNAKAIEVWKHSAPRNQRLIAAPQARHVCERPRRQEMCDWAHSFR
jgi:hypothetical protein